MIKKEIFLLVSLQILKKVSCNDIAVTPCTVYAHENFESNTYGSCQSAVVPVHNFTDDEDDEYDWNEIPIAIRNFLETQEWITKEDWDADDDDDEENEEIRREVYRILDCNADEEDLLMWHELGEDRQRTYRARFWTEEMWNNADPCKPSITRSTKENFNPFTIQIEIPELQSLNLDHLENYETDMRLVDGYSSSKGSFHNEDFLGKMSVKEFIGNVKKGDTRHYIHLEESMEEKKALHDGVGKKILTHLRDAIKHNPRLRESGQWKPEWDDLEKDSYDWAMFIGAKNTHTHMHYDADVFNFLYLVEGRKRIVLVPNDERTNGKFNVEWNEDGGTGWTGENILVGDLPEHAVEIELQAGEGIAIPFLSWHAVENLETSLAYSFRIVD